MTRRFLVYLRFIDRAARRGWQPLTAARSISRASDVGELLAAGLAATDRWRRLALTPLGQAALARAQGVRS